MIAGLIQTLRALGAVFAFVPGWIWASIVAGLVATNCTTGMQLERERRAHATTRADHAAAALAATENARLRERSAAATLSNVIQKAADETVHLQRRVVALTHSLRNRPERPAASGDVPAGAAHPVACTGAGLYRSDSEFLVREAARADQLRIDLATCRAAYDAAVKLTN